MDGMDDTTRDEELRAGATAREDDRLLSYALGLEPDPELEAALAGDAGLRARLDAVRAEVGAVQQGLERVAPAPPDGYTDLGGDRWVGLKPLLRQPRPRRRRQGSWLRVLAPVAAVVLVLGFGAVAMQYAGRGAAEEGASTSATDSGEKAAPLDEGAPTLGEPNGAGAPETGGDRATRQAAAHFELVVVARAEAPAAGKQEFTIERALKGEAPARVRLTVTDRALPPDTLVVLYLLPSGEVTDLQGGATPTPATPEASVLAFRWRRQAALVEPLPPGTSADDVAL